MTSASRKTINKLQQYAVLVAPGLNPCGCVVSRVGLTDGRADITLGHLTSPAMASQINSAPPATVDIHIPVDTGTAPRFHFRGKLTGADSAHFILSVSAPQTTLDDLASSLKSERKHPMVSDPATNDALKRLYQQHGIRLLERLLPDFLDMAGSGIEQDLENAAEMRDITRLKDMRFIFSSRQPQICQDFEARFTANNSTLTNDQTDQKAHPELHVLQQQVFEDWLDLQTVASRLSGHHTEKLFALNQLLGQVFRIDVTEATNPLSPGSLCSCLQYAIDRLGIASEHRKTIYGAFETALNDAWPPAVEALIEDLTRAGLTTLGYSQLPPNWSSRGGPEVAGDEASERPGGTENAAESRTQDTIDNDLPENAGSRSPYQSLFRLMGLESTGNTGPAGWQPSSPEFCADLKPKRSDLLERLQSSQPELSFALRDLANQDPDFGSSVDDSTLAKANLVDQLFAPLQAQPRISSGLRDKLEQLRLPVFEALLETPEFLNDEDHPAREIVNSLMRLCFAERASTKNLESTVSDIIDDLIHTDSLTPEQLGSLNSKLRTLVERQDQSFVRNSERLAKTLEGKERLNKTRKQVQRELNGIVGGQEIPTVLLTLLAAGWEQLMVLAMLREGPDSHYYGELLEVVSLLKTWLTPDTPHDEVAFERELESDNVLRFIDRELRTIGDITRFRSLMSELTGQLQQQQSISTVYLDVYGDKPVAEQQQEEVKQDRWTTRARELTVGDWVEITLDDGEVRKLRLVWGGEDVLRFVFLSPTGMSEISFNFQEFVQKLRSGDASLVEEGDIPFVDQSLFNMVQDVYRRLNFQATHDALTKCMHRHDFEKLVSAVVARGSRSDVAGALVVLDIDEFSVINSTYGAEAGDRLLEATGALIQKHCALQTPEPHAGRISGNEFAVLIDGLPTEESLDFAERLRQDFEDQEFAHGEASYRATLSASVCPITSKAVSAGDLLNAASLSLKSVKRLGGNRVELVRESGPQSKAETPQWVSEIDRSIRDGSLFIRAQAIVPLENANQSGKSYELLLGLTDAAGNQVSPQAYIEAAEQFRRSTRVDLWVVQEVIDWMNSNPDVLAGIDTLNVNLSGASLSDDRFMLDLENLLRSNQALTPKICFEVTETSAVANLHYAADFMRELKRLHCRFALDDFGTGLSSYAYLQKLPVDYVKIDGIFVRDMATNLTNYAMVRSINELCHFLDLKTIAEYVENLEIMETLREIQVDYAQGFGIAKPRRLDSLTRDIVLPTGACL